MAESQQSCSFRRRDVEDHRPNLSGQTQLEGLGRVRGGSNRSAEPRRGRSIQNDPGSFHGGFREMTTIKAILTGGFLALIANSVISDLPNPMAEQASCDQAQDCAPSEVTK